MKNIGLFILMILFSTQIFAQNVPQGMNYQAVARDAKGQIISKQEIAIEIQLLANSPEGKAVYSEQHLVETNELGLFTMIIGEGIATNGKFIDVPWAESDIWMAIGLDDKGGNNFELLNTSRLLTVPYAFHAGSAETLIVHEHDEKRRCPITGLPFWSILGNDNVTDTCHFIGTTIPVDLVFKTDSIERMRITAAGDIIIAGDLSVLGNMDVGIDLTVGNDASIGNNLQVDNDANIDGDLTVGGNGEFFDLTVLNDLTVGRDGSFARDVRIDNDLEVGNNGSIAKDLDIGNDLNVANNTQMDGNTTVDGQLNANGRLVVTGGASGSDGSIGSYPALIQGSNQGLAIKVNGSRNTDNNFISFWDDNGMHGRIEGETLSELQAGFDFTWWTTHEALQTVFQALMVGADIVGVDDGDAAIIEGLNWVELIVHWGAVGTHWEENAGIAFKSGNGDYAEWLEKAYPDEIFTYGDIVGVIGGKVSKRFGDAKKYMVVSKSPIVLGNMPDSGKEAAYEKIAFIGQVPVKVKGKVEIGDYIIASDQEDGFGRAVHPDKISFNQLDKIVGVAWSVSQNGNGYSLINTAVGINTNDASAKLQQQEARIDFLSEQLNMIASYLKDKDPSFDAELFDIEESEKSEDPGMVENQLLNLDQTADQLIDLLEGNLDLIEAIQAEARRLLDEKNVDYNLYDQTRLLVTDVDYFLQNLRDLY